MLLSRSMDGREGGGGGKPEPGRLGRYIDILAVSPTYSSLTRSEPFMQQMSSRIGALAGTKISYLQQVSKLCSALI